MLWLKITQERLSPLNKFSCFRKIQSIIAYCFRFFNNYKIKDQKSRIKGGLSQTELNTALQGIIKFTQAEAFPKELRTLSRNEFVNSKIPFVRLNSFLDQGVNRVGGRLIHANIPDEKKHPIVLPKNYNITKILIRDEHKKLFRAGHNAKIHKVPEL